METTKPTSHLSKQAYNEMLLNAYQFLSSIENIKNVNCGTGMTAFDISSALSVCLNVSKETIMHDYIQIASNQVKLS